MTNDRRFTYQEISRGYKEEEYFEKVLIKINLKINDPQKGYLPSYEIKSLDLENESNVKGPFLNMIKEIKKEIENEIEHYRKNQLREWNLFYLYKEFFQKLGNDYNYFRGQSTNWEMLPGVLRKNVSSEFQNQFEVIYQDIMYKYPDLIEYYDPIATKDGIKKRELQLAHLQHYGLKTSLVDITENPFIALLFMVSESSKNDFENAIIDIYNINFKEHQKNNIFSKVKFLKSNSRLIAQKGAFFNFDKVALYLKNVRQENIKKIPLIRIQLNPSYPILEEKEKLLETNKKKEKEISDKIGATIHKNENTESDKEKDNKIRFKINGSIFNLLKEKKEIEDKIKTIKEDIKTIDNYYYSFLDSIRIQIKQKLEEFYYKERDLFPDLYKHIDYVQANYEENSYKDKLKKPELKRTKKDKSTKNSLKFLVKSSNDEN